MPTEKTEKISWKIIVYIVALLVILFLLFWPALNNSSSQHQPIDPLDDPNPNITLREMMHITVFETQKHLNTGDAIRLADNQIYWEEFIYSTCDLEMRLAPVGTDQESYMNTCMQQSMIARLEYLSGMLGYLMGGENK